MKRVLALIAALCLLTVSAVAESAGDTRAVEMVKDGLTVYRCKSVGQTDTQTYKLDYPAFESSDATLASYLTQTVAEPLLALRKIDAMSAENAYTADTKDSVRISFFASLEFDGILSLEASVSNRAADLSVNEMLFFYRIIDLAQRRELTVYDLFNEQRDVVDVAIRNAVFTIQNGQGLAIVGDASQVPAPNSIYLTKAVFRCLYAAGTVSQKATVVDIPWEQLGLTQSPVLLGEASATVADQSALMAAHPDAQSADSDADDGDGDVADDPSADDAEPLSADEFLQRLTANDWIVNGDTLHFTPDGTITDPTDGNSLFIAYRVLDGKLYLSSAERPDQGVSVYEIQGGLNMLFDAETSDYINLTFLATAASQPTLPPTVAPAADTQAPPVAVTTPTPMPVSGDDAQTLSFLTQGLWKRLGTDGNTYYQFLPDGTLLTIQVTPYTLTDGALGSDAISGTVRIGGTAFTLTQADGNEVGFVLNRSATAVPGEAFVTASPTPLPTPTPTPSPEPTASPTPSPTPMPTPTLSPYEQAAASAPTIATLPDAAFEKRQTLKVYSAPDLKSYRDSKAQVTTDETVQIFGVTGDWVLVSYKIGNGSRGRIGYIANTTLANADAVAKLTFADITLTLTKKANATDDPLNGKSKLFEVKQGASVKLLAFLGVDWAYVETTYKDKPCRVFIPRSALMAE